MDLSDTDYSEAGDSGWTMYLDHSASASRHHFDYHNGETKQELDEDSSMVSDASSGPPYYCEEAVPAEKVFQQNTQFWCKSKSKSKSKINNKKKNKTLHAEQGFNERFSSCLEDTASSLPVGEEFWEHKQHLEQHQPSDYFSRSYSTRRILKDKYNSGYLRQAFPVNNKLPFDNQGSSDQSKRRGQRVEI